MVANVRSHFSVVEDLLGGTGGSVDAFSDMILGGRVGWLGVGKSGKGARCPCGSSFSLSICTLFISKMTAISPDNHHGAIPTDTTNTKLPHGKLPLCLIRILSEARTQHLSSTQESFRKAKRP